MYNRAVWITCWYDNTMIRRGHPGWLGQGQCHNKVSIDVVQAVCTHTNYCVLNAKLKSVEKTYRHTYGQTDRRTGMKADRQAVNADGRTGRYEGRPTGVEGWRTGRQTDRNILFHILALIYLTNRECMLSAVSTLLTQTVRQPDLNGVFLHKLFFLSK